MNYLFTPPIATKVIPPSLPDDDESTQQFFDHYRPSDRAVNVYELNDGTFAQDYPTPENSNTAIPMPLDPLHPGAPYSTIYNPIGQTNGLNVPTFQSLTLFVITIYYGGRQTLVSSVVAARLTTAGYGSCLVPA